MMAAPPWLAAVRWSSALLRVVVMLLPAFYCSWTAFRLTFKLTLPPEAGDGISRASWIRDTTEQSTSDVKHTRARIRTFDSTETRCFPYNSIEWLEGPRLGNSPDAFVDGITFGGQQSIAADVLSLSASSSSRLRPILQQSLCDEQSPFLSINSDRLSEERAIRLWTARLLFMVVHEHQHRPAALEAEIRTDAQCIQAAKDYGIRSFDYECPAAKFLVVSFYKNGIGANMRLAAVPALLAGIATGRVVLFINHAATGPAFLQEPWALASCDHRRDAQCFFRPASPCALTDRELDRAYMLQRGEMRRVFRYGQVPEDRIDDRVLIMHLSFRPQRQPENLRDILHNKSMALIERLVTDDAANLLPPPTLLYKAADAILQEEVPPTAAFNYYGAGSQIFHSLLLYAMRPNHRAAAKVDEILQEVIPSDFLADDSLGLPIRGTYTAVIYA
jgi:hypothetical protein